MLIAPKQSYGLQIWRACFQGQSRHDPLKILLKGGICKNSLGGDMHSRDGLLVQLAFMWTGSSTRWVSSMALGMRVKSYSRIADTSTGVACEGGLWCFGGITGRFLPFLSSHFHPVTVSLLESVDGVEAFFSSTFISSCCFAVGHWNFTVCLHLHVEKSF